MRGEQSDHRVSLAARRLATLGAAIALACVLTISGCSNRTATTAPAAASPSAIATTPEPSETQVGSATAAATATTRLAPTLISIPAIGVNSTLVRLGLTKDGTLDVPTEAMTAGWYTGSPVPGLVGPSVIAGHVHWSGAYDPPDEVVRDRLREVELQRASAGEVRPEVGQQLRVALRHRVQAHVTVPAGHMDDPASLKRECRHVVRDRLGRRGELIDDDPTDLINHVAGPRSQRGQVVVDRLADRHPRHSSESAASFCAAARRSALTSASVGNVFAIRR